MESERKEPAQTSSRTCKTEIEPEWLEVLGFVGDTLSKVTPWGFLLAVLFQSERLWDAIIALNAISILFLVPVFVWAELKYRRWK